MFEFEQTAIAALGFGSAWMLLWAAAAAIPIAIHFWHRTRRRVEPWAAMRFLAVAVRQRAKRLRLEQYALLILRVSVLVLLAFILADPTWTSSSISNSPVDRKPRHWILVFDASYSMGHQVGLRSCFERAKQQAQAIITNARDGDGFSMVRMGDPVQTIIGRPTRDPRVARSELNRLSIGHQGANLSQGLVHIASILRETQSEDHQFETHDVLWLTDLMRNTWGVAKEDAIQRSLNQLPRATTLSIIDVGLTTEPANLTISEIRRSKGFVTTSDEVSFEVSIANHGARPMTQARVDFFVDGEAIDRATFDAPPDSIRSVSIHHRFLTAGEHTVMTRLSDDSIAADNVRYQVVPVTTSIQVLCVEGHIHASSFVGTALRPNDNLDDRFAVHSIDASDLPDERLDPYHAIVMCNVAAIDRQRAALLTSFIDRGGGLVLFLGDAVVPSRYNDFADADSPTRILPARLNGNAPFGQYRLDPKEYAHAIIKPFELHPNTGLLSTPIWRYTRLDPIDSESIAVPLGLDNGDAFIVEETRSRSRVAIVSTSVSDVYGDPRQETSPWSLWPVWPSFPPLMHELIQRVIDRQHENRNVLIGETINGFAPASAEGYEVNLIRDESNPVRLPIDVSTGAWTYGETWKRGVHRARFLGHEGPDELYGVNFDSSESQLDRVSENEIPDRVRLIPSVQAASLDLTPGDRARKQILAGLFGLLFVSLVAESILAWRLGQTR